MSKIEISASLLAADFNNLDSELSRIEKAGINYLHFDVMDGVFVNNISFGIPVLKSISSYHPSLVKDVHLMIVDPKKYYEQFIEAGADIITFHYETMNGDDKVDELINLIKKRNVKVGISIKPSTSVAKILKFIDKIDLVLIMSVEPGFGGQSFNDMALLKIKELNNLQKENLIISVDGGINDKTSPLVLEAGANMLVSGSYIFASKNIEESVKKLLCH